MRRFSKQQVRSRTLKNLRTNDSIRTLWSIKLNKSSFLLTCYYDYVVDWVRFLSDCPVGLMKWIWLFYWFVYIHNYKALFPSFHCCLLWRTHCARMDFLVCLFVLVLVLVSFCGFCFSGFCCNGKVVSFEHISSHFSLYFPVEIVS